MAILANEQINLLRQNARSVVRELGLLNEAYFEVGVTLAERHLLIELSSSKASLTAGDIAERLLIDKSTVSRLVARATKKGFISCVIDKKDKRKRFLQLTEFGKSTLFTFEPIAFNQSKKALQTLSFREIDLVYRGVALYAQGLRSSRLQNVVSSPLVRIKTLEEVQNHLSQLGYTLETNTNDDAEQLLGIFKEVVESGCQFLSECGSREEFQAQFLSSTSRVYVCRTMHGQVIGGFYLKSNYSGRSGHIANAAYMLTSTHRGKGIGTLLVMASLHLARNLGFQAMQFNMVFSQNIGAIKLYEKLGFEILGTIPNAIRNPDGSFQDGHTMYRRTDDL